MSGSVRSEKASARGYILLETLVALTILSIGLAGIFAAFHASLRASGHARNVSIATFLAEEKLAELRALSTHVIGTHKGDFGEDFTRYRWRTVIKPLDEENLYAVTVEVFWMERGQERSIVFPSLLRIEPVG